MTHAERSGDRGRVIGLQERRLGPTILRTYRTKLDIDEADVSVATTITDVRAGDPTGPDYNPNPSGPDLTLAVKLRLTDLFNGSSQADPATATDFDLVVPVDCVDTAGSDGATCSANTSAEALTPGFVGENHRTILQGFRLRVNDAGADGIRGNSDDKLFEQQGFFEP